MMKILKKLSCYILGCSLLVIGWEMVLEALIISEYAPFITQSSLIKPLVSSESAFWSVKNDLSVANSTLALLGYLNFLHIFEDRF